MARGRDIFYMVTPLLMFAETIFSRLPSRARLIVMDWLRYRKGLLGIAARYVAVRTLAGSVGDVVLIYEDVYFKGIAKLSLGSHISIHPMTYIDAAGGIRIGNNVSIAHGVTIMSTNHTFDNPDVPIRESPLENSEVKIGDDVWIGAGVKIMAGTKIGDRVVLGAGAVVTRDIPSNTVAVGVPARPIKSIHPQWPSAEY